MGEIEAAIANYEKAIKFNRKSSRLYRILGDGFRQIGAVEKAVNAYEQGIELGSKPLSQNKRSSR